MPDASLYKTVDFGTLTPPRRSRKALVVRGLAVFVFIVLMTLWYMGQIITGNVRVVQSGKVYRSAQLTGHNLAQVLDSDHIRTVINLRGGSMENGYYRSEVLECKERGIKHVDAPFSARFLPPPERLRQVLQAFDHEPYPVLVHCHSGSDRTGLVCTLYAALYEHEPLDEAEELQLTWRYGHIPFATAHAMDDFFNMYRQSASGTDLRTWILTRYPALYAKSPEALRGDAPDVQPVRRAP